MSKGLRGLCCRSPQTPSCELLHLLCHRDPSGDAWVGLVWFGLLQVNFWGDRRCQEVGRAVPGPVRDSTAARDN